MVDVVGGGRMHLMHAVRSVHSARQWNRGIWRRATLHHKLGLPRAGHSERCVRNLDPTLAFLCLPYLVNCMAYPRIAWICVIRMHPVLGTTYVQ